MKLECMREKIVQALIRADKVTGKNPTLAILSSVVLGASDNQLVIKATNLEMGLELTIPAKVEISGVVALSASVLASFLSNIPDEKNVTLTMDEGILQVACGPHKASMKTVPYEDFPVIPSSAPETVELNIEDLRKALLSVWYSASLSSIKPELGSVYLHSGEMGLVAVATDSFRLAEKKINLKKPLSEMELLIPSKNIPDLIRVFEGEEGTMTLAYNKNQLSCSLGGIYITSRLIDSTFVDYKKIIPTEHATEVVLLKDDLVQALRMMRIFSDKFNQISISVNGPKGICEFISKNSEVGEGVYAIKAKVTGDTVKLNFNHKYLSDCLSSIAGESVVMRFNGPLKALCIQAYNDPSFTYLVMPNR